MPPKNELKLGGMCDMFTFYVLNGSEWTRKESKPIEIWFRHGLCVCYTIQRFYAFLCRGRVSKYAHMPMSARAYSKTGTHDG